MLRVAYDHQVFCDQPYGGISRYVVEVAKRVHQAPDTEARIFSGLHLNRYLLEEPLACDVGRYVAPIRRTMRLRMAANAAWARVGMGAWQPHVVHETYYHPTGWAPKSAKVVVTVHDMIHELFPEMFPPDSPVRGWKRAALARAHGVVCVSETTKRDLLRLFPDLAVPVAVIPHGHGYKPASAASLAKVKQLTGGKPFVLFVGNRWLYKDFNVLLQAYASSPTLRHSHLVVGFGGGALQPSELQDMQALNVNANQVCQFGGDDDVLHACYELAGAFVYPSRYEGFGIPILEAQAAGCPTICSDTPVFQEVAHAQVRFFKMGEADSLQAVLEDVMQHPKAPAEPPSVNPNYSWDKSATDHLAFYAHVSKQ